MKIYTQEVPEEVVNYLEGLDYDINALQNFIAFQQEVKKVEKSQLLIQKKEDFQL